jgi:hypothetical protein
LTRLKTPLVAGAIGLIVAVLLCCTWWYVNSHEVFHHVYWSSLNGNRGMTTPGYDRLQKITFVLCPPSLILIFGMDMGWVASLLLWFVAAVLNFGLYFTIGFTIVSLLRIPAN